MKYYFGVAEDKYKHFILSAVLVFIFYVACHSIIIASVCSFIIGVLKEIYDKVSGKGVADMKDIAADIVGIGFAVIILMLKMIIHSEPFFQK